MSKKQEKIDELLKNLDEDPDLLHNDITPAVLELAKLGLEVIPCLKEPLNSTDEITRLHAQRTLEFIISYHFGFVAGKGWAIPNGEEKFRDLWKKNGSYDFEALAEDRNKSIEAWMDWFQKNV